MASERKGFNPFYPLTVVLGVVFLITACAYGVMAFRGATPQLINASEEPGIMRFLSKHGSTLFLVELGALMVATVAAIATDEYWTGKQPAHAAPEDDVHGQATQFADVSEGAQTTDTAASDAAGTEGVDP